MMSRVCILIIKDIVSDDKVSSVVLGHGNGCMCIVLVTTAIHSAHLFIVFINYIN